jgi:carotenoid cleavage dioxygenase
LRLAPTGALRTAKLIELPEASLMHDFAVTERHIVLLLPPLIAHDGPANSLVDRYGWRADKPLIALVIDKETLEIQRSHELPARFLFHIGNAWEDTSGAIRLDACLDDDSTFATRTARDIVLGRGDAPLSARPSMIVLPAAGGAGTITPLDEGVGEFPRIDPRRVGMRHRYSHGIVESGVATWDWDRGAREVFAYPADARSEEPVFVPRGGDERDGWLVQTVLDTRSARTLLCIFDARRTGDGPIARYACPYPLPLGFHGTFVAA